MLPAIFIAIFLFSAIECKPTSSVETKVINLPGGGQEIVRVHHVTKTITGGQQIDVNRQEIAHKAAQQVINTAQQAVNNAQQVVTGAQQVVNKPASAQGNSKCQHGVLAGTVSGLRHTLSSGVVGGASRLINSITDSGTLLGPVGAAVNTVGQGAGELLHHALNGVGGALSDVLCGVGDAVDTAANALDNGDILGGVAGVLGVAANTVGNTLGGVASEAIGGITGALSKVEDFLSF